MKRGSQAHAGGPEMPTPTSSGCLTYRTARKLVPSQANKPDERTHIERVPAECSLNSTDRIGQRGPAHLLYRTWAPYNLSLWCAARTFTQQVRGFRLLVTREGFQVIFIMPKRKNNNNGTPIKKGIFILQ